MSQLAQNFDHSKYVEHTYGSRFRPGDLCWARKDELQVWPAIVLDPSNEELKSYPRSKGIHVYVNFFAIDKRKFVIESQIWDFQQGCKKFSHMKGNMLYQKAVNTIIQIGHSLYELSDSEFELDINNVSHYNQSARGNHQLLNNEENSVEQESRRKLKNCNAKSGIFFFSRQNQQNGTDSLPLVHKSGNSLPTASLSLNESVENILTEHEKTANNRNECLKTVETLSELQHAKNSSHERVNALTNANSSQTTFQSKPIRFVRQPTLEILNEKNQKAVSTVLQSETTPGSVSETNSRHVRTPAEILTYMLSHIELTEQQNKAKEVKHTAKNQLKRKGEIEKKQQIAEFDVYEFHEESFESNEALSPHRPKKTQRNTVQTVKHTSLSGYKFYPQKSPTLASTNHKVIKSHQKVFPTPKKMTQPPQKVFPTPKKMTQPPQKVFPTSKKMTQTPQKVTQRFQKRTGSRGNVTVKRKIASDSCSLVLTEPVSKDNEKNSSDVCITPQCVLKCMPSIVAERFSGEGALKSKTFSPSNLSFGFMGLGNLGRKLVSKIIISGHTLTVWNRNPIRCYEFVDMGAKMVREPVEVVTGCEVIFCCLRDANAVKEVLYHDSGVLEELKYGKGFVNLTTMDYETALDVKDIVESTGAGYLEAPISSYKKKQTEDEDPENAYMTVTAGDPEVLNKCLTCIASFSACIYHLGPVPKATHMVLAMNSFVGSITASFAQGFALGKQSGVPFDDLYKILTSTSFLTPTMYSHLKDVSENKEDNHTPPLVYNNALKAVLDYNDDYPLPVLATAKEAYIGNHLRKYT